MGQFLVRMTMGRWWKRPRLQSTWGISPTRWWKAWHLLVSIDMRDTKLTNNDNEDYDMMTSSEEVIEQASNLSWWFFPRRVRNRCSERAGDCKKIKFGAASRRSRLTWGCWKEIYFKKVAKSLQDTLNRGYYPTPDHPRMARWHERAWTLLTTCGELWSSLVVILYVMLIMSWAGLDAKALRTPRWTTKSTNPTK